jgi:hypothetical protein
MNKPIFIGILGTVISVFISGFLLFYPPQIFDHVHRQTEIGLSFGEMVEFELAQPFFSGQDGLTGLELAVKNPHGRKLSIQIVEPDGTVVRKLPGTRIKWDGFHVFGFEPIPDSKGKTYTLKVTVDEPGRKIEFFGAAESDAGQPRLHVNSVDTNSRLFYRLLHRVGYKELGSLIRRRIGTAKPAPFGSPAMLILHVLLFSGMGVLTGVLTVSHSSSRPGSPGPG